MWGQGRAALRHVTIAAGVLLAPTFGGCFRYVPADLGGVDPGREVRLQISRQGMADLPAIPEDVVRGRIADSAPERLRVLLPVASRMDGAVYRTIGQEVEIPTRYVETFEVREFAPVRTGLLVVGGLVAVLLAVLGFDDGSADQSPPDTDPPVEGTRIPLILSLPPH